MALYKFTYLLTYVCHSWNEVSVQTSG